MIVVISIGTIALERGNWGAFSYEQTGQNSYLIGYKEQNLRDHNNVLLNETAFNDIWKVPMTIMQYIWFRKLYSASKLMFNNIIISSNGFCLLYYCGIFFIPEYSCYSYPSNSDINLCFLK